MRYEISGQLRLTLYMSKNTLSIFLLLVLSVIWGSSFILMKRGMISTDGHTIFSDAQVGALRMLLAALVLVPFTILALKKIKTIADFISLSIVGLCGNFIPAFLFTYAETELSSGYAGMLNSFTPIFTLIIGGAIFKQKLTPPQFIGVLIAFVGMVLLMTAGNSIGDQAAWKCIMAIILATFLYAVSLNTIKYRVSHFSSVDITALAFGILLIPSIIANLSLNTYDVFQTNTHAWEGFGYILVLSVVGTAFAVIIFNRVIAMSSTLFASSVTYFIPIVAVLFGAVNGETINNKQIGSMIIVLIGVFVANYWHLIFHSTKEKTR